MFSCKKETNKTQDAIYDQKWTYVKTVSSNIGSHSYTTSIEFSPNSYVIFTNDNNVKVNECNTNCVTTTETCSLISVNDYYKINTSYRFWQYLNDPHLIYLLKVDENNIVVAHGMNTLPNASGVYSGTDEVFWFYYRKG